MPVSQTLRVADPSCAVATAVPRFVVSPRSPTFAEMLRFAKKGVLPLTTIDHDFWKRVQNSECQAPIFNFLGATSVVSVSLWFINSQESPPQRHKEHRGFTEKS